MSESMIATAPPAVTPAPRERRRRFISAYWLRPENAFWMVLRSDALRRADLRGPMLDVSCGDGVFSFLHAGGRVDPSFDVFEAVAEVRAGDLKHPDMFDHAADDYQPPITRRVAEPIACGTDCKPSMLHKASRLNCYDRLVSHDNNDPLPFEDGEFQTVYCNAAYWTENIAGFLAELRRVTAAGGSIVLQVKLDDIRRFTMEKHRNVLGDRWLDLVDRGRVSCWPSLCDRSTWERRFASAGMDIVSADAFVTGTHAHVWDIGMRPIAPLLTKAMNAIHPHLRAEIKRDWVDLFCDLLEPFCQADLDLFTGATEPVEIQYVLSPK